MAQAAQQGCLGDAAGDEREGAVCDAVRTRAAAAVVDASLLAHVTVAQARNAHRRITQKTAAAAAAERKIEMTNFSLLENCKKKKVLFTRVNNQPALFVSVLPHQRSREVICYSSACAYR